jgi:pilus assembly protein CpaD
MSRTIALTLAAASVALGACSHTNGDLAYAMREQAQPAPVQVTAELRLTPEDSADRLDPEGVDAVRRFAAAYREEGDGPLVISRPRSANDEVAGMRLAGEIRALLVSEGIEPVSIRDAAYEANGAAQAPTLVAYSAWEAQVSDCPAIGAMDLTVTRSNMALPSFGCATAHNLAVMIADPRDLVGEQALGAPDPVRRSAVFAKYRDGQPTAASPNSGGKVSISGAVGN